MLCFFLAFFTFIFDPSNNASQVASRGSPRSPWSMASSLAPERVRNVRVAIVGDSGCGKSVLCRMLAGEDASSSTSTSSTSGVNPKVRLIDVFDASLNAQRPHFVELWDTGGRNEHAHERAGLWHDLDGVVLVHDLSLKRRGSVVRWAREVARSATFKTPSPDVCAWGDAGGGEGNGDGKERRDGTGTTTRGNPNILDRFENVPVPVLVVGCKSDLEKVSDENKNEASDDFFGEARAGGFDASERAVAFFVRVFRSAGTVLRLRGNGNTSRWRWTAKNKRKHSRTGSGILPTTIADLTRAFSTDTLHEFGMNERNDEHSELIKSGGLKCCALSDSSVDLGAFDSYFRELIGRRYGNGNASSAGGAGAVRGGFQFASVSEPGGPFSRPDKPTLAGGGASLRWAQHTTQTMWMGGDRMDAGDV